MEARKPRPELIAIVGPTASGKSDLAVRIAKNFKGEIIAADSRTIFRGLDIGTAKPSPTDLEAVQHWGIDLVDPGDPFTVADFKEYADDKIKEMTHRDKLPIVVGGTGLYVDSVLYDFKFRKLPSLEYRAKLEGLSIEQLHKIIADNSYHMPENRYNRRHLVRAIETEGQLPQKGDLRPNTLLVGILPPDENLRERIDRRAEVMFDQGVINEYKTLVRTHPRIDPTSVGIVYKLCSEVVSNSMSIKEAKSLFKKADWQYARRQRTWFKRNKDIKWFTDGKSAEQFIYKCLNT